MVHQSRRHAWALWRAAFSVTENWFFSFNNLQWFATAVRSAIYQWLVRRETGKE
jgi:hypothetical protein